MPSFYTALRVGILAAMVLLAVVQGKALHVPESGSLEARAAAGNRLVFSHFIIGVVADRTSSADYDADMQRAKDAGIDAFALNIGVDSYTDQQLGYAYDSANRLGMLVFLSFDFNFWSPSNAQGVGQKIAQYANLPAQLKVNGRVFASSFIGDGLDVNAVRSAAGTNVYFVPNFHPGQSDPSTIDGGFAWGEWANNGNNKAPTPGNNITSQDIDNSYLAWLGGKPFMASLSPWFFTHYGPEVSYSKNWVFPSGRLIFDRWNEILQGGPAFVEIVTWNDIGESHYMGPLSSKHNDDGNSKWGNDMTHDGWLDLSVPFIAAYKAGAMSVNSFITEEKVIYWYRRTLASLDCDATDTTMEPANNASGNYFEGRPNGWQSLPDEVYVVTLLQSPGTMTVTSGGQTVTQNVPAGANIFSVPSNVGKQHFTLTRGGSVVFDGDSLMDIANVCPCGIYNFNAYVGTLPPGFSDPLGPDGLVSLTVGLHVTTCLPTPSLGTSPPITGGGNPPPSQSVPAPTSTAVSGQQCNGGTVAAGQSGNLIGLCNFACSYGYCPSGSCLCTSFGTPGTPPASSGYDGCPLSGESDAYKGLCSYTCSHGYCPSSACQKC